MRSKKRPRSKKALQKSRPQLVEKLAALQAPTADINKMNQEIFKKRYR